MRPRKTSWGTQGSCAFDGGEDSGAFVRGFKAPARDTAKTTTVTERSLITLVLLFPFHGTGSSARARGILTQRGVHVWGGAFKHAPRENFTGSPECLVHRCNCGLRVGPGSPTWGQRWPEHAGQRTLRKNN